MLQSQVVVGKDTNEQDYFPAVDPVSVAEALIALYGLDSIESVRFMI